MRKIVLFMLFGSLMYGLQNVSLSRLLLRFKGNEYNMLLAPKEVVVAGKKRKTRKAINRGYKRAIREIMRQLYLRKLDFNIKAFGPNGSNVKEYQEEDKEAYKILKEMLKTQINLRGQIFSSIPKENTPIKTKTTADDIDLDIGDDAFDISQEKTSNMAVSPADAFRESFIELSELYNQQVLELYKALHPFNVKGKTVKKRVNSVFGMAFFPDKDGSVHIIKIYLFLGIINSESQNPVQIIVKEIPNFIWERNALYISGATGKVLRQLISNILGESFSIR